MSLKDQLQLCDLWDVVCRWVAFHLPRRIVMWATLRLFAAATTGKYSHQIVPELKATDALQRWEL